MATTTQALASDTPKATACPRCRKPLTDAAGLGWCQSCGYCQALDDPATRNLLPGAPVKPAAAAVALRQAGGAVAQLPLWTYALAAGVIAIFVLSLWKGRQLPPDSLPRALWTSFQIGAGLLMIFFAQFIALVRVAPEDPLLNFKDMFVPFRLWSQVFKRAGKLGLPLVLGSWGLAIALSASIFIGGLGHWMTYLPGGKNAPAKKVDS